LWYVKVVPDDENNNDEKRGGNGGCCSTRYRLEWANLNERSEWSRKSDAMKKRRPSMVKRQSKPAGGGGGGSSDDDSTHTNTSADKHSNRTTIQEAAEAVDGMVLMVFYDIFQKTMGNNNGEEDAVPEECLSKHHSDDENQRTIRMLRNGRELRRLLNRKMMCVPNNNNTKENDDGDDDNQSLSTSSSSSQPTTTYLLHAAAEASHPSTLKLCRYLVDELRVINVDDLLDEKGRSARSIAIANPYCRDKARWAKEYGCFLGRYILRGSCNGGDGGLESAVPVYKSKNCTVHFATDVTKEESDDAREVAIKVIRGEDNDVFYKDRLGRLLKSTKDIGENEDVPTNCNLYDNQYVVPVYRHHSVNSPQNECCLIFERNDKNLNQIIYTEDVSNKDQDRIRNFAKCLAEAVRHVHSRNRIHGDVKPENVVRSRSHGGGGENDTLGGGSSENLKLIGLDKSMEIGTTLTTYSSAYVSPKVARNQFAKKNDNDDNDEIVKEIKALSNQLHSLDLTQTEDITSYRKINQRIQSLLSLQVASNTTQQDDDVNDTNVATVAADVWAYGVSVYHLLTGKPLFACDARGDLLNETETFRLLTWSGLEEEEEEDNDIFEKDTELSLEFRQLAKSFLRKCLHANGKERFQSMNAILSHEFFHGM